MTTEEIIQTTRNLISEHFSDITFIEEGHKYFIGTEEYTPVSNIIENFVRPFDKHTISERYAKKNGLDVTKRPDCCGILASPAQYRRGPPTLKEIPHEPTPP